MRPGRPRLFLIFVIQLLCWSQGGLLHAQTFPLSLEIRPMDEEARIGKPLRMSVRALNPDGSLSDSWQANVTVRALMPAGAPPVLSEIDTLAGTIEVTNPGDREVDVSGWELQAWTPQVFANTGSAWVRLPAGSVMPGRSVFTWTPSASTPSLFPQLTGGRAFGTPSFPVALVRLVDGSGTTIDQVWIGTPGILLAEMDRRGPALQAPLSGASLLRMGSGNHWANQDWTNGVPSPGITNNQLRLPWAPVQIRDLATIQITHGTWTGEVPIPSLEAAVLTLQADDGAGLVGSTGPLNLRAEPPLTLTLPSTAIEASELSAGPLGEVVISIPAPRSTPLTIQLALDASGEFDLPASVTLPAGSTSASVAIANLNDGIPDGDALVKLTASASGFASAVGTLLNRDGQSTGFTIVAPDSLSENLGLSVWGGEVLLPFVPAHTVSVRLFAESPLQVPGEVLLPVGTRSAPFWIRSSDDSVANDPPYTAVITGRTGSGPAADARVSIRDDESALYTLSFPKSLLEGSDTNGHVHLAVAHGADIRIRLYSESPRLLLPSLVLVPAGAVDVDFVVSAPNDSLTNGMTEVAVRYAVGSAPEQISWITVIDDEFQADTVRLQMGGICFLNSLLASFNCSILNRFGADQAYYGPGAINMGDLAKASITPLEPIRFANGFWSGRVKFSGEGLNLPVTLSAAGTNSIPLRVDVLQGTLLSRPVLDVAGTQGSSKLLALAAATNNTPAILMEVDAVSGVTNRILALPRRANRIALSDDGAVAWLASSTGTLQRVDVSAWQFDREVALSGLTPSPRALDLVVLPGSRDRVAVIIAGSGSAVTKVALVDNGTVVGNAAPLGGSIFNVRLIRGRNSAEAFSQTSSSLSRYKLGVDGVTLLTTTNLSNSSIVSPNLSLAENRLFHGDGAVFRADDLSLIQPDFLADGLTAVLDERKTQLFLDPQSMTLKARALDSWASLPGHSLPYRPAKGSRLVRWGSRGMAYIEDSGAKLVMLESPLLDANQPSLDLRLEPVAAIQLRNSPPSYTPTNSQVSYVISNSGPFMARGNVLESSLSAVQPLWLPDLAPGESTLVRLPFVAYAPGILQVRSTLQSASGNVSSNASIETAIRIHGPDQAGVRELILGATAIAGNPSGDRLYASVSRLAGDVRDGVAVIDPESGDELSFLRTAGSPGKLLTSDNGSSLYVAIGTNSLARWNLGTGSNEFSILIPNDSILDFQPVAGSPRSVVIATTRKVFLYSDDQQLPLSVLASASDSRLAYSGTNLWSYTPIALRRLSVKPDGLVIASSGSTLPVSYGYRFLVGDGLHLFASGPPLNTATMTVAEGYPQATGMVIDPPNGELLGVFFGALRRFARESFSTLETQPLTPAGLPLYSPVLWGNDGIAVMSSDARVFLAHTPLRHRGAEVDVSLSITPPVHPIAQEPAIWRIAITNQSSLASGPVRLSVRALGSPVGPMQFEGIAMTARLDEFVGILPSVPALSSAEVLLHAVPLAGGSRVEASILSTNPDPTPEDHSAASDINAAYPDGDLVLLTLPPAGPVKVGTPFRFGVVLSNAGPVSIRQTTVSVLSGGAGLQLQHPQCEGCELSLLDASIFTPTQPLAPGQAVTLWFDGTATLPGIHSIHAYLGGWVNDLNSENNEGGFDLATDPPVAPGSVANFGTAGITSLAWYPQRDQLLLLPTRDPALWLVDPDTLAPTNRVAMPGQPAELSVCDDGIHAWVLTLNRRAVLVNLETSTIERSFDYAPSGGRALSAASPPGNPGTVVLAILSPDDSGQVVLQRFVDGVAQGSTVSEPPFALYWTKLLFLKNGQLVARTMDSLRSYSIVPGGFELQSNLDSLACCSNFPDDPSEINGALLLRDGRILRFDTQQADGTLAGYGAHVQDEQRGLILRASLYLSQEGERTLRIEGFDRVSLQRRYLTDLPSTLITAEPESVRMVTLGAHGVLLLSDPGLVFRPEASGPASVAISAGFRSAGSVELSPADVEVTLSVTNSSTWATRDGTIDVSLPSGMIFAPDSVGAGSRQLRLQMDSLIGVTNYVFKVRSEVPGEARVTATIRSDLQDVSGGPVIVSTSLNVLAPPVFLLSDVAVQEGTSGTPRPLAVRLSRPTGHRVEVRYSALFNTADAADVIASSGSLVFAPGDTLAMLSLVVSDSRPELDESLRLRLSSADATLLQSEVGVMILDDDLPVLGGSPISILEGNEGIIEAEVRLTLSRPTPRLVSFQYATLEGTAFSGVDFLPRSGSVSFAPGQTSAVVRIPVIGDVRLEPNETFTVALPEVIGALRGVGGVTVTILNDDVRPYITAISVDPPLVVLSFDSAPSTAYRVQSTTDLGSGVWTTQPDVIMGTGSSVRIPLKLPAGDSWFFRVVSQ